MKTTQWIIAVVSFMLVFANLRMLGVDNQVIQKYVMQVESACTGKSGCLKKAEVTRHLLALLKDQGEQRMNKLQQIPPHRRYADHGRIKRVEQHMIGLEKMQRFIKKYTEYLTVREKKAQQMPEVKVEYESNAAPEEALVDQKIAVGMDPVPLPEKNKQDDSVSIALNQIHEKINDLYAQREREQYINQLTDRIKEQEHQERISPDRLGWKINQPQITSQPIMLQQPQMYMPQQQFIAHSIGMPVQNNYQQQMAMQMQSQAMALQQQASMLMMQAQNQPQSFTPVVQQPMVIPQYAPYQPGVQQPSYVNKMNVDHPSIELLTQDSSGKRQRINKLMSLLHELADSGKSTLKRLLQLIDAEFQIMELLIAGNNAAHIQQAVKKKDKLLAVSEPTVVEAYDQIIDLASSADHDMQSSYYQFTVKNEQRDRPLGNRYTIKNTNPKKTFLTNMMNALEHYYLIIENMQSAFNTIKR